MKMRSNEQLRITLSNVGVRAVVSVNCFVVTEMAFVGQWDNPYEWSFDATRWLRVGKNILAVVLIGEPDMTPFRMEVRQSGHPPWTLDEEDMLPPAAPWRFWSQPIELVSDRPIESIPFQ